VKKPLWILTDIEGTTTSISFVHDVLFPYARERMGKFLESNSQNENVMRVVSDLKKRLQLSTLAEVTSVLETWMSEDRKETELKALQGILWRDGYEGGDFRGHVYPDVAPALERWRAEGIALAVYSSGSVAAQKLLFGYSEAGDLDGLFDANFDTRIGHKREVSSYQQIAAQLSVSPGEVLFLSDVGAELAAATQSGMLVLQLMRPQNQRDPRFESVESFTEIDQLWA
jgi:enolase-phosphatase E1